jgi:predicted nucleic acid-binding protein
MVPPVFFEVRPHHERISQLTIWELRNNLTAYDAAYVVPAEVLGAPLITLDMRLVRSRGHRANVEMI